VEHLTITGTSAHPTREMQTLNEQLAPVGRCTQSSPRS